MGRNVRWIGLIIILVGVISSLIGYEPFYIDHYSFIETRMDEVYPEYYSASIPLERGDRMQATVNFTIKHIPSTYPITQLLDYDTLRLLDEASYQSFIKDRYLYKALTYAKRINVYIVYNNSHVIFTKSIYFEYNANATGNYYVLTWFPFKPYKANLTYYKISRGPNYTLIYALLVITVMLGIIQNFYDKIKALYRYVRSKMGST